ncbi:MAG: glycosyltransferase [Pseudomonadota bacterium]
MPAKSDIDSTVVLYSTDEAFLPITCISARSMTEHCSGTPPPVTILLHDVSQASAERAAGFLTQAGITARFVAVDPSWCEPWASARGQSAAKFGPLRLDEWMEDGVKRVIVVDSDTRFLGAVDELVRLDLQGMVLAAVDDIAMVADGKLPQLRGKLGLPADAGYFNSGLMVVDLARWTEDGIGPAATAVFTERPEILTFNDQCALNAVLAGRYLRLPFRWNCLNGSTPLDWPVCLAHYAGHFKPWSLGPLRRLADITAFVGRHNIDYYDTAMDELSAAHLAPGRRLRDTFYYLSIYAKWRINGKLREVQSRPQSEHLKAHVSRHPQLMG